MISTAKFLTILRNACTAAGTQKAWAKAHNISTAHVTDVLSGRRAPSAKIAAALGFTPIRVFDRVAGKEKSE